MGFAGFRDFNGLSGQSTECIAKVIVDPVVSKIPDRDLPGNLYEISIILTIRSFNPAGSRKKETEFSEKTRFHPRIFTRVQPQYFRQVWE